MKAPPQEQAFLDGVAARADDDVPRLVFADWLDDHNFPSKGRVQRVEVATGPAGGNATGR